MKLIDRIKGDAFALLVWGVATCASCRTATPQGFQPDGTRVKPLPTVKMDEALLNPFEFGYFLSQAANVENGWCLYGTKDRQGNYVVTQARTPFVHEAGPHHIRMSCKDDRGFLGIAHTHDNRQPYNTPCAHSPVDREEFLKEPNIKVSAVYCGKGDISLLVKP